MTEYAGEHRPCGFRLLQARHYRHAVDRIMKVLGAKHRTDVTCLFVVDGASVLLDADDELFVVLKKYL